jgi:hypothetical protein
MLVTLAAAAFVGGRPFITLLIIAPLVVAPFIITSFVVTSLLFILFRIRMMFAAAAAVVADAFLFNFRNSAHFSNLRTRI